MKHIFTLLFAALAFAACTQNDVDELSTVRQDLPQILTAGFEGDDTRIQLNEAGKTVWTKDDLVSVFYLSNANQKWQYQGETGERVGVLKCVESVLPTKETDYVVVAYPYNDNYYLNASSCNLRASLPATQHYAKDSYGLDGNIMVSRSEYNQVSLRNVCGWLKVQLAGDNQVVKSIKLYGNNGEQVAGELYINTNDATAILASDMGTMPDSDKEGAGGVGGGLQFNNTIYTDVTLICDENVVLGDKATAFYIALPPQTFENGVTVEVKCKGYEPMVISTDKTLTIQRNHIKPMETIEFNAKEKDFDITVTDIEAMRAAIKIVPSKGNETFCWICGAYDGESTAEEVMNSIVEMYGGWMNNGAMLYKGTQDFTGGPGSSYKYKLDAPDTEYYVLAFGYAGGVTTLPEMVTFRTLPGADPMEVEFSMVASNITPYSANISVKVSDESVYYTGSAISPEAYNKEELVAAFNEEFDYILELSQEMDPNTTVANLLRTYYWNGSQELGATGLLPETELMGFIFALDTKTGHVARVIEFPGLATTSSLGDVVPSIELVGYYSGDDEAGAIFGQPAATKGKAITVVKYDNFDGARMLFTTLIEGDCTSVTAYPDTDMWAFSTGYWSNCKVSEPYTFYVSEWETEYTAMVYATDSNGNIGSFGRLYTMATAENKGDINELKELYNNLTGSSKYAAKASVVVGEPRQSAAPVITNITPAKAAVAAPAVEEVREEVAVELPSMVMVENVAPFRFRK